MPVVYPTREIAQHWNGALERRLRRAPLERFLQVNDLGLTAPGRSQLNDNLLAATTFIVKRTLEQHLPTAGESVPAKARHNVADLACVVSRALADGISEPLEWRVAALRCTADLLRARSGLRAAAMTAAALVRRHHAVLSKPMSAADRDISTRVGALLKETSAGATNEDWAYIASRLSAASFRGKHETRAHTSRTGARS